MNEKIIERYLYKEVKKRGGIALKFASSFRTGMPDRIVLMPGGVAAFVELKTTGLQAEPLQEYNIRKLQELGFEARVVDSIPGVLDLIDDLEGRAKK